MRQRPHFPQPRYDIRVYKNFINIHFFKLGADPESFPNVPPNSVTVDMSDNTRYGITLRRLEDYSRPYWVLDLSTPVDHYAHVHLTETHHYDTPAALNFINYVRFNDHNPYTHAPDKAYVRIGEDHYYTARNFENFYYQILEYDYDNKIIVSMPGGPLFIANLVKLQNKPVCIVDAELLARYNRRMTPAESSAALQSFQPEKKSGIFKYFS